MYLSYIKCLSIGRRPLYPGNVSKNRKKDEKLPTLPTDDSKFVLFLSKLSRWPNGDLFFVGQKRISLPIDTSHILPRPCPCPRPSKACRCQKGGSHLPLHCAQQDHYHPHYRSSNLLASCNSVKDQLNESLAWQLIASRVQGLRSNQVSRDASGLKRRPEVRSHRPVSPGRRNTQCCRHMGLGVKKVTFPDAFYTCFRSVFTQVNSLSLSLIKTLLAIGNIEKNPGPCDMLKLVSVNCRGLSDNGKLLRTISKIKKCLQSNPGPGIAFLQETHSVNEYLLAGVWTGDYVIGNGTRSQRGVLTLVTGGLTLTQSITDPEGRFCISVFKFADPSSRSICTINVYAPNDHSLSLAFFHDLFSRIASSIENLDLAVCDIIVAGDFNFVFDSSTDSVNRSSTRMEKALSNYVTGALADLELFDLVQSSSQLNNFTWRRQDCRSRIDYVFVSARLASMVNTYSTEWNLIPTDHAAIVIDFKKMPNQKRGYSYPKLTEADISDPSDMETTRLAIATAIRDSSSFDPHTRLEFVKMAIRSAVLDLRKAKRKVAEELPMLKAKLNELLNNGHCDKDSESEIESLHKTIWELEEAIEKKLMIQAGIKWREEGERSSKYFLNQISTRNISSCNASFISDGKILNSISDIMEYGTSFYADLYSKVPTCQTNGDFLSNCPKISETDVRLLQLPITVAELGATLKTCKDSCPGLDGIPYSFYKYFGDYLLPLVVDSFNYGNRIGRLSPSHTRSCITIIPKAGKDQRYIRNWRPITVSACDIKLVTKSLALRLAKVLDSVISKHQMAYIPGRDINFNNRLLNFIVDSADCLNPLSILSFDAEKAFDSIDHDYIRSVLRAYGLPEEFIKLFNLLYRNIDAVLQINGWLSKPFNIGRGVKQGCALSCCLFVLCIDPLLRNVDANHSIKGVLTSRVDCIKMLSYADDVVAIVQDNESIQEIFHEYERLYRYSGLRLNASKTELMSTAIAPPQSAPLLVQYLGDEVSLVTVDRLKVCGNTVTVDREVRYAENVTKRISKLEHITRIWKSRNLSLNGKMIILKTFALSQLVFVSQFMNISPTDVKYIESICYNFAWNGKRDRIKRAVLKSSKDQGGINGIDVDCFLKAIKVKQFLKADAKSESLSSIQASPDSFEPIKIIARQCLYKLYKAHSIGLSERNLSNDHKVILANYDLRGFLKPGSKAEHILFNNEIKTFAQLLDSTLTRRSMNTVLRALPLEFKATLTGDYEYRLPQFGTHNGNRQVCFLTCPTKVIQQELKSVMKKVCPPREWLPGTVVNWRRLWNIKNPTLRAIRYKIAHNDIFCNYRRFKCKLNIDDKCTICGETESVLHQLFECQNAQRLWLTVNKVLCTPIASLKDIVETNRSASEEILISAILKALIQIDRSAKTPTKALLMSALCYLRIEEWVSKGNVPCILAEKVKALIDSAT